MTRNGSFLAFFWHIGITEKEKVRCEFPSPENLAIAACWGLNGKEPRNSATEGKMTDE